MESAVTRVLQAIDGGENILVYGDYDVDGTTSVSLMYSFLSQLTDQVSYYIPDRYKEGYGVSFQGIDFAHDNGVGLIITLDCGIKAVDKVAKAKEYGIDVIICDHHRPGAQLPDAIAVLDPKRNDCAYPYKELCGCGVGYKLATAIARRRDLPSETFEQYLDLVAVAIGADIVPITGENRILMHYGMAKVNRNASPGMAALMKVAQIKKTMSVTDLVFTIAPRINAAGRIKSGMDAVDLLTATDEQSVMAMAQEIDGHNRDRKELDKRITEEALEQIESEAGSEQLRSTVVYREDWHKGVVGIVASRLMETYYRPTIVLTGSDGKVTGSARSVRHFDVYDAIDACSDLLLNFGGHKYAAGLTMEADKLPEFKRRFEAQVRSTLDLSLLSPELTVDAELPLSSVTPSFYKILRQMAPFGPGNMRPVFVAHDCFDFKGQSKVLKDKHLRVMVTQGDDDRPPIQGIAFGMAHALEIVQSGRPFSIAFNIEENVWNDRVTMQLMVKDIRYTVDARQ